VWGDQTTPRTVWENVWPRVSSFTHIQSRPPPVPRGPLELPYYACHFDHMFVITYY
jgi:hypothetical protein